MVHGRGSALPVVGRWKKVQLVVHVIERYFPRLGVAAVPEHPDSGFGGRSINTAAAGRVGRATGRTSLARSSMTRIGR